MNKILIALTLLFHVHSAYTQSESELQKNELELLEKEDLELLNDTAAEFKDAKSLLDDNSDLDLSSLEEDDDLQSLKNDIGETFLEDVVKEDKNIRKLKKKKDEMIPAKKIEKKVAKKEETKKDEKKKPTIFEVGKEEKELLGLSEFVKYKMPDNEWEEISGKSKLEKYEVQEGDYLWKISQNLFGSGFYYSKIWSLNPQIKNPHEIEPGMMLIFDLGSADAMPDVKVGRFEDSGVVAPVRMSDKTKSKFDFNDFGDNVVPPWIDERKKLIEQGVFFQFASDETYDDLMDIGKRQLTTEYEKYNPPVPKIIIKEPSEDYDASGFDKNSKVSFEVKEGFFLNTFVTTNVVEDLGKIDSKKSESVFIQKFETVYVEFDESVKVKPGDQFSVYSAGGKIRHTVSDRDGFKYTIVAQIKAIRPRNHLWECVVTDLTGLVHRGDRVTLYTPKIKKITKTFNKRFVEAAVIGSFRDTVGSGNSFGDVIYLDRGRADGVELGNVFELYSFTDRGTGKRITPDPTYKVGELTVITLTDNFSTALITQSRSEISYGMLALTKTEEQAAKAARLKGKTMLQGVKDQEGKALEELDIELNLDDLSEDLLDQADKMKLTDDELEELERQEREKSILKEHEKDLQSLEKLESEIIDAENKMNEAKLDEDAFLEQQDLNAVEQNTKKPDPNAFESLDEIEQEVGKKYLDEDLNSKDNPYGLTEYDLEEVDELLNEDVEAQ